MKRQYIILQDTLCNGIIPFYSPFPFPGEAAYEPFLFDTFREAQLDLLDTWKMIVEGRDDPNDDEQLDGWIEECEVQEDGTIWLVTSDRELTRADIFAAFGIDDAQPSEVTHG